MGRCAEIQCPKCNKAFVITITMLDEPEEIKFHCPWCDYYFIKEESPNIQT